MTRALGLGTLRVVEHWEAIAAERLELADVLGALDAEQWAAPSLCEGWSVRDVAAHLVFPLNSLAAPRIGIALLRSLGNFHRANQLVTAAEARRPTGDLVADLRAHSASHFTPPGFGSVAPLTDVLVHGCDIRVPLGLGDDRPVGRWQPVLDFLVTPKARRGFLGAPLPDVRLEATDLDWSSGSGEAVRAPAAILALAMLRRRSAASGELGGPGAATMTAWMSDS